MGETDQFDGKLTKKELINLKTAGITKKQIRDIEKFLDKYKTVLTGFSDLVGDDLIPKRSKQIFENRKELLKGLDDELTVDFDKGITLPKEPP